jgi:antitoxin YefM
MVMKTAKSAKNRAKSSGKATVATRKRAAAEPAVSPPIDDLAAVQPLVTVKARFSEFVDRVNAYRDRITITRNGVPVAVLLGADDFEALEATIDLLSDPEAMAALEASKADIVAGRVLDADELRRSLDR